MLILSFHASCMHHHKLFCGFLRLTVSSFIIIVCEQASNVKCCVVFQVQKQMKRIELAWPLGAMFNVYGKFVRQTV